MSPHRVINWLLAAIMAAGLSSAYLLDGPTDIEAAQDIAADVQDAQVQAAAARHLTFSNHPEHQP